MQTHSQDKPQLFVRHALVALRYDACAGDRATVRARPEDAPPAVWVEIHVSNAECEAPHLVLEVWEIPRALAGQDAQQGPAQHRSRR